MGNILNIINSDKDFYNSNNTNIECGKGAFITDQIKKNFKINWTELENVKEGEKYIYLVETNNTNNIISIIKNIPNDVVKIINKNMCKFIISFESEGDMDIHQFNNMFVENKNFDYKNVFIFTGDMRCAEKNKTPINFFGSSHFLDTLAYDFNRIRNENFELELSEFQYNYNVKSIDDIDIDKKSKHFLCYLRNCSKLNRKILASYFQYHKLWDINNISFLKINWDNTQPDFLPKKYLQSFFELNNTSIVELDTKLLENKSGFNTMFSSDWKHNQESFLTIVPETIYEKDIIFITEKIVKPIINLQPFVVVTAPRFLKFLRELGFKTFDGFIDESYDEQNNNEKRFEMIFNELDKFRSRTNEELKDWWKQILPILEHNQNRLLEIGRQKTEKIKLLENLYD